MFNKIFDGFSQLIHETDSTKKLAIRAVLMFILSLIGGGVFTGALIWTNQDTVISYVLSHGDRSFQEIVLSRTEVLKTFGTAVGAKIIGVAEYRGGYSEVIWISDEDLADELLGVKVGSTTSISSAIDRYSAHLRGSCYAEPRANLRNSITWILSVPIISEGRLQGYLGAALSPEISASLQKREMSILEAKEKFCPNLYSGASYLRTVAR